MKSYPSIAFAKQMLSKVPGEQNWFVFDKIDGSNIRAEWSKKKGWHRFGTRRRLLDETDTQFGSAVGLVMEQADAFEKVFREQRYESAIVFFEYWGDSSFCGTHKEDEEHRVTLIDVAPFKKGILMPKEFLKLFGDFDHAPLLHQGTIDADFVESVAAGNFEGVSSEGVVCKTHARKTLKPIMFKVKTRKWLSELRQFCGEDEALFEKLR